MSSEPSAASEATRRRARRVSAEWLEGNPEPSAEDWANHRSDHPDLAAELDLLWAELEELEELLDLSRADVIAHLRERWGEDGSTRVSNSPPKGIAPDHILLKHLSSIDPTRQRYTIREEVARGGMGVVYRVWDEDLGRYLAMKVMRSRMRSRLEPDRMLVDDRSLASFLDEVQITSQLDHPGIVPVHELGLDEAGQVFFTMRLVRGQTLGEVFRLAEEGKDGWNQTRAVGVLLKACEAVGFAQSKGVIHRDLKPANIMVGRFGEAYVMDWGLAQVMGREDTHKRPVIAGVNSSIHVIQADKGAENEEFSHFARSVQGTPAYMAPEQANPWIVEIGPEADVYSLGAILYRLLSGTRPYGHEAPKAGARDRLRLVRSGPPRSLGEFTERDIPASLRAIADKAMSREPANRYRNAMQMAAELRNYLEDRVVDAGSKPTAAMRFRWLGQHPIAAMVIAFSMVLAAGLLWQRSNRFSRSLTSLTELREKESAALAALQALNRSRRLGDDPARDLLFALRAAQLQDSLRSSSHDLELRSAALTAMDSNRLVRRFEGGTACRFGPRGMWLAVGYTDGHVSLKHVDPDGATVELGKLHSHAASQLAFDRLGSVLASQDESGELVLQTIPRGPRKILKTGAGTPLLLDIQADLLLSVSTEGSISSYHVPSGQPLAHVEHHQTIERAQLDESGRRFWILSHAGELSLWNAPSGELIQQVATHVKDAKFRPDSGELIYLLVDGSLLREAQSSALKPSQFPAGTHHISASGQGVFGSGQAGLWAQWDRDPSLTQLAIKPLFEISVSNNGRRLIGVDDMHGGVFIELPEGQASVAFAANEIPMRALWSPNGGHFALFPSHELVATQPVANQANISGAAPAQSRVELWSAQGSPYLPELLAHNRAVSALAFASKNDRLAIGSKDRSLSLWTLDNPCAPRYLGTIRDLPGPVELIEFHPRDERLLYLAGDHLLRYADALHLSSGGDSSLAHPARVGVARWDHGGRIWSGCDDGFVRCFDEQMEVVQLELGQSVSDLRFNAEGDWAVAIGTEGAAIAFQLEQPRASLQRFNLGQSGPAQANLVFDESGEKLLRLDASGVVSSIDVAGGSVRQLDLHGIAEQLFHSGSSNYFARANGRQLGRLTATDSANDMQVADALHSQPIQFLREAGAWSVSSDGSARLRLWNADQLKLGAIFDGHHAPVEACAITSDGAWIASGDQSGRVRLWPTDPFEVAQQQLPRRLTAQESLQLEPASALSHQ